MSTGLFWFAALGLVCRCLRFIVVILLCVLLFVFGLFALFVLLVSLGLLLVGGFYANLIDSVG